MQRIHSSFKITLLLYIVVLILPFSFYFVYSSFKTMQEDTKTVQLVSWTAGAVENLALNSSVQDNKDLVMKVDKTLQEISAWVAKNNRSEYYIGAGKLSEDFSEAHACWSSFKQKLLQKDSNTVRKQSLECYTLAENLAIIIEKMVYLKQNKMINTFYLSLILAMILLLLVIYFVRVYIRQQIKKHAIHDLETHLFNRKYFLAQLHTAVERAKRENSPLSMFFLSVDNFGTYDAKQQKHLVQKVGHILGIVTRESDTVCRYDDNHFAVLMALTDKENALHLETRMREALSKHDFQITPEPQFGFKTTQLNDNETKEDFMERSRN